MSTPRRTRGHVTGDVGRTAVKLLLEEWGWTADIVQSDYGEDLDCAVFIAGQRTALHFRCQIKASPQPKRNRSGDYSVRVNATTCAAWLQSYYPVFLVLYDCGTKEPYFVNATAALRKDTAVLTRRSVSFRIPSVAALRLQREALVKDVQDYFAEFLRVSDSVHCTAFPVLMPSYRMALPLAAFAIEGWEWENRHRDRLPAWTTVFETIDSEYLYGVRRDFAGASVEEVYRDLATGLARCERVEKAGQWMALACCPIGFRGLPSDGLSIWTGELTEWRTIARIGGEVFDDRKYAFAPPNGFVTEVARHTLSWDDYYHVDASRDLAIQLYAAAPLTPAFRGRSHSLRRNAAGQLLPWSCALNDIASLNATLGTIGLVFSSIGQFCTTQKATGVIHSPMFVVQEGFTSMPMALDWETFDEGAVRKAINLLPSGALPGAEAGSDVLDYALSQVPYLPLNPQETFYGVQRDTPLGLPVNLANRKIVVERFHALAGAFDESVCDEQADQTRRRLLEKCPALGAVDVEFGPFSTDLYSMIRLGVSWHPELRESSADAFLGVESALLEEFDLLLPRRAHPGAGPHGTFDVLSFAGNIHFNPDYWSAYR